MIPGGAHALMLGGDPCEQYQIGHSVRFNAADTPYLSRTPGVAGNRKTWTSSAWVKRSLLTGGAKTIFSAGGGANRFGVFLDWTNNDFEIHGNGATLRATTQAFRDPGAHAHVFVALDTTDVVDQNRLRVWISGVEVTAFNVNASIALNADFDVNSVTAHAIGRNTELSNYHYDGYLSEIHFVDGQALDPSAFGFFCTTTGQWRPKAYTGTYGTNGFHLDFSDGSAATAAALGADRSGNGNNWTPTNISVAAGAGCDWVEDTPTNNFCTLNPLPLYLNSGMYFIDSNLGVSGYADATTSSLIGTHELTEKIYFEVTASANAGYGQSGIGVANASKIISVIKWLGSGGDYAAYGTYGLAFDRATGNIWIKTPAGAWAGGGDPVAGTSPTATIALGSDPAFPVVGIGRTTGTTNVGSSVLNAGQRSFVHAPPAGFKAIGTKNLPKSGTVTVSGSFTGNANADGPFVWMNGTPATLTINGNPVTFGTHADALANGFKIRTSSASYNAAGSNTWTATIVSDFRSIFRHQNAKGN